MRTLLPELKKKKRHSAIQLIYIQTNLGSMHDDRESNFLEFKFLYFLTFGGLGVLFSYLPVYYESLSFSKAQIGVLCMIPSICTFLTAPLLSILGDIFQAHYELIIISLISSAITMLLQLPVKTYGLLSALTCISSVLRAPLTPQVDALVISSIPNKLIYGNIRLWGAVGYGIFSLFGGWITDTGSSANRLKKDQEDLTAASFRLVFYFHGILFFLAGFLLIYLVYRHRFGTKAEEKTAFLTELSPLLETGTPEQLYQESSHPPAPGILSSLKKVFTTDQKALTVFSFVVFSSGFSTGVIYSFLFIRLAQLGGSGLVMGVSRFITCAAEVPMFQIAGFLQEKFGIWPLLAVTQLAFAVRFLYYSWLTTPWYILPIELLHGLTYATMWSVSCSYTNKISPPDCHSTLQTLLNGLHWGIGSAVGSLIGGFVYDSYGAVTLFLMSALLSVFSMILSMTMIGSETAVSHHSSESVHTEQDEYEMISANAVNANPDYASTIGQEGM
jgi:predicted MFS family arabinose efflux permease